MVVVLVIRDWRRSPVGGAPPLVCRRNCGVGTWWLSLALDASGREPSGTQQGDEAGDHEESRERKRG